MPLGSLLKAHAIERIDFLNIDVEGKDLEVLESHDWSIPVRLIAVEDVTFKADAPMESACFQFLTEKGYALVAHAPLTLLFMKEGRM